MSRSKKTERRTSAKDHKEHDRKKRPKRHKDSVEFFTPFTDMQLMGARDLSALVLKEPEHHWGRFVCSGQLGMNCPRFCRHFRAVQFG